MIFEWILRTCINFQCFQNNLMSLWLWLNFQNCWKFIHNKNLKCSKYRHFKTHFRANEIVPVFETMKTVHAAKKSTNVYESFHFQKIQIILQSQIENLWEESRFVQVSWPFWLKLIYKNCHVDHKFQKSGVSPGQIFLG